MPTAPAATPSTKRRSSRARAKSPVQRPRKIFGTTRISIRSLLGNLLLDLPDDEVFSSDEIKMKLNCPGIGGRVRDWIKEFPRHYIVTGRGMVIGTPKAINTFCKFHNLPNPWLR